MMEGITIPQTFMELVTLIGSPVFIGVVLSLLLKNWTWFMQLQSKVKWILTLLVAVALPVISRVLILYLPTGFVMIAEDWWPTLMIGFTVWVSSQVWNDTYNLPMFVRKQNIK